jgi:hypothetical protein
MWPLVKIGFDAITAFVSPVKWPPVFYENLIARLYIPKVRSSVMAEIKRESTQGEDRRNEFRQFAPRRYRERRTTESSLGPDSSGRPSSAFREVGCFVDAGAVSATAPAQNRGEHFHNSPTDVGRKRGTNENQAGVESESIGA